MMALFASVALAFVPDHRCLGSAEDPGPRVVVEAPSEGSDCIIVSPDEALEIPLSGTATGLALRWSRFAPAGAHDTAATLTVRYADGHEEVTRATQGLHVWPWWMAQTTPWAWSEPLGRAVDGQAVSVAVHVLGTDAERELASLTVHSRAHDLALFEVQTLEGDARLAPQRDLPGADWTPFTIPSLHAGPSMPVGARAGSDGRLEACGEDLCFGSGAQARLWGINLVGDGALPPLERADRYADELARAGFNLVRLHHLDRPGQASVLHPDRGRGGPLLDPEAVDRLDRFAAALLERGVYLVLEGPTARVLRASEAQDVIGAPPGLKHLPAFQDDFQAAYLDWFDALYDRVNPYTGQRWLDDPGVAWVELANESSLVAAWLGGQLESLQPAHRQALDARWNAWLRARYVDDDALAAAWVGSAHPGLALGESMLLDSVARDPTVRGFTSAWPARRSRDLYRFYAELELAWLSSVEHHLRAAEYTGLINGTMLWGRPQSDRLQQGFDVSDLHVYLDMVWKRRLQQGLDPVEVPQAQGLPERLGRSLVGQPSAITELNHGGPLPDPKKALLWSVLASAQGVDAVAWFAYSHVAWSEERALIAGALELRDDPSFWAQAPLAARLYRSGAVPEAPGLAVRWTNKAATEEALGDVAERPPGTHLDPQNLLRQRLRSSYDPEPPASIPGAPIAGVRWLDGVLEVETSEIVAVAGHLSEHELGQVRLSASGEGTVWLASTELGVTLQAARSWWLVQSAGAANTGARVSGTGEVVSWGAGPVLHGSVHGHVALSAPCRPTMTVLDGDGSALRTERLRRHQGAWQVPLPPESPWARLDCDG